MPAKPLPSPLFSIGNGKAEPSLVRTTARTSCAQSASSTRARRPGKPAHSWTAKKPTVLP